MKSVLGIIAEYNPFHNGHLYQIEKAKEECNADYVVVVMSGNFVQRGLPAVMNKWDRAKIAIENGVDLVIELPTIFSISNAENFANGGIKILNELGIVNHVAFGMECDNLNSINEISELMLNEPQELSINIKEELQKGVSYPLARQNAIFKYTRNNAFKEILNKPNNILAIEYLKALKRISSPIIPIGIKRYMVDSNSESFNDSYASSSLIRKLIFENKWDKILQVVPKKSFSNLKKSYEDGRCAYDLKTFEREIIYKLRTMSIEEIKNLPDVSEGLENLIYKAVGETNNIDELINLIKNKRITQTKIQRIMLYALLGITKKDMDDSMNIDPYIRILGFSKKGENLLKDIETNVITSIKRFEETNSKKELQRMLEIDKLSSNIYSIFYKNGSKTNLDYTQGLIK